MPTPSLVIKVEADERKRLRLPIAVSIPLDLVSPVAESKEKSGIGLLDTGAELSLVCEKMLAELQALPHGIKWFRGIHGEPRETDTYLVDLHFVVSGQNAWTVKRIEVGPLENSATVQVLIGMDVLAERASE